MKLRYNLHLILIGMLTLFSTCAHAAIDSNSSDVLPLNEYQATYVIKWHGIPGGESAHRLKRRPDGLYHVQSVTEPYIKLLPLSFIEKADFKWQAGKIVPQNYYYNIQEGRRHKKGNVHFDWQNKKVFNHVSKEPWESELKDGLLDKLTHTIQLRLDLINNPKDSYTYTVAEDDEIKPYTFDVLGEEMLETDLGNIKTLKIKHTSKKGRRTLMWLSAEHRYLPIRVEHFRDGGKVGSGEIKSYSPNT